MPHEEQWLDLVIGASIGIAAFLTVRFAPGSLLSMALVLGFLLYQSHSIGHRIAKNVPPLAAGFFGLFALLAAQAILLTLWYRIDGLGSFRIDTIALIVSAACLHLLLRSWHDSHSHDLRPEGSDASGFRLQALGPLLLSLLPLLLSLVACLYVVRAAHLNATVASIQTPWAVLPVATLFAFGVMALLPWILAWLEPNKPLRVAAATAILLFAVFSVTPLLYPLGYGFDGFLHRATEHLFLTQGTLDPKPLYYIGQYTLISFFSRLTGFGVDVLDRWLIPVFASLLPLIYALLNRRRSAWETAAFTFLLPLAPFIATTPQSLAYLVGLCALLAALSEASIWLPLVLVAWCLAIHPLAALPLGGIALALLLLREPPHAWKKIAAVGLLALSCISVPASFFLLGSGSAVSIKWHTEELTRLTAFLPSPASLLPPATHVSLWSDWADLVAWMMPFVLILAALVAIKKDKEQRMAWILSLLGAVGLWIASEFLKHAGEFSFLIDYERGDYPERLTLIAFLVLFPAAATGLGTLLRDRLPQRTPILAACLLGFLTLATAGQVYNAFPRHDASQAGHGWNAGQWDFEAVRFIDRDAAGKPYTVLANQSVSAAAVATLGFKRYAGDVFFYPIPTGGPLYQTFLRASGAEPSLDDIKEAATLGGSDVVYVVLNDYWWDAERVGERLAGLAEARWSFGDRVNVYRFTINPNNASR